MKRNLSDIFLNYIRNIEKLLVEVRRCYLEDFAVYHCTFRVTKEFSKRIDRAVQLDEDRTKSDFIRNLILGELERLGI